MVRHTINWSSWRAAAGSTALRYGTIGAAELWEHQGCGRSRGAAGVRGGGRGMGAAEVQAVEVQARPRWETEWTGCFSWPHQAVETMLSMKSRRVGGGGLFAGGSLEGHIGRPDDESVGSWPLLCYGSFFFLVFR